MNTSSDEIGERFASDLGEGPSRSTLAAQRVLVLEMAERSLRPRARPRSWAYALVLVPLSALAIVALYTVWRPRALEARFAGAPIRVDTELSASEKTARALAFSDGSQVVLEQSARATLSTLTPEHAAVRLEEGRVSASIRKHPGMTWTVTAGPYAVNVVGTRFSVAWNAHDSALEVLVREGRVRVTGGDLPASGVVLDPGDRFERRTSKPVTEPEPTTEHPPDEADSRKPSGEKRPGVAPEASGSQAISALASKGKYKEALALAEKQGFTRLTVELPENDLLALANAARYSGDAARAREALVKLRERFAGRPAANLAALYLAKIAENMTHDPGGAVRWLRVFLQDSPSGDLAAGARASLMSLLLQTGDRAGARAAAEDYLRHDPNGTHAGEARAIVGE